MKCSLVCWLYPFSLALSPTSWSFFFKFWWGIFILLDIFFLCRLMLLLRSLVMPLLFVLVLWNYRWSINIFFLPWLEIDFFFPFTVPWNRGALSKDIGAHSNCLMFRSSVDFLVKQSFVWFFSHPALWLEPIYVDW